MTQRITDLNWRKDKIKKKEIPRLCPQCKSQRLKPLVGKKEGITLDGFFCAKCGYQHARRLQ